MPKTSHPNVSSNWRLEAPEHRRRRRRRPGLAAVATIVAGLAAFWTAIIGQTFPQLWRDHFRDEDAVVRKFQNRVDQACDRAIPVARREALVNAEKGLKFVDQITPTLARIEPPAIYESEFARLQRDLRVARTLTSDALTTEFGGAKNDRSRTYRQASRAFLQVSDDATTLEVRRCSIDAIDVASRVYPTELD